MTEKEIIKDVAVAVDCSEKDAKTIIDAYLDVLVKGAQADGKAVFGKIGTFKMSDVKATAARYGVKNALTGGTYDVEAKPARKKLAFSLSKSGKEIGK